MFPRSPRLVANCTGEIIMSELEHWENRYQTGDIPWDTGHPSTELIRVLTENKIEPCTTIDLGCGTGSNSLYFAERGFTVTGVDLSSKAIELARARPVTSKTHVRFLTGDLLD